MNKLFLSFLCFIGLTTLCFADAAANAQKKDDGVALPNSHVSLTVNQSTFVSVLHAGDCAVISSRPVELHSIVVGGKGTSSKLEIWNSRVSTTAAGIQKIGEIDTTALGNYVFDVFLDSGIAIAESGAAAGKSTINYRQR